jgi:hypothetical protein
VILPNGQLGKWGGRKDLPKVAWLAMAKVLNPVNSREKLGKYLSASLRVFLFNFEVRPEDLSLT